MAGRRDVLLGGGALALAGAGVAYFGLQRMGSMETYNASVAMTRAALAQTPDMLDFVRYATLGPSGHNTQPWRFRAGAGQIDILPDLSRRTPVVDRSITISLSAWAAPPRISLLRPARAADAAERK
jgi:hypothetical protein